MATRTGSTRWPGRQAGTVQGCRGRDGGGRQLASASSDHSVRVWNVLTGGAAREKRLVPRGFVESVLVGHLQTALASAVRPLRAVC